LKYFSGEAPKLEQSAAVSGFSQCFRYLSVHVRTTSPQDVREDEDEDVDEASTTR